jgi:hypothetical protein
MLCGVLRLLGGLDGIREDPPRGFTRTEAVRSGSVRLAIRPWYVHSERRRKCRLTRAAPVRKRILINRVVGHMQVLALNPGGGLGAGDDRTHMDRVSPHRTSRGAATGGRSSVEVEGHGFDQVLCLSISPWRTGKRDWERQDPDPPRLTWHVRSA